MSETRYSQPYILYRGVRGVSLLNPQHPPRRVDTEQSHGMSEYDFNLHTGDTAPALTVCLYDGYEPIDLTGASAKLVMHHIDEDITVEGICNVLDEGGGRIAYEWDSGDTDTAGTYDAKFVVDYDGNDTLQTFDGDESFPPGDYLRIRVREDF